MRDSPCKKFLFLFLFSGFFIFLNIGSEKLRIKKMEGLLLPKNLLNAVPLATFDLMNLMHLDLAENQIRFLPAALFSSFPQLRILNLGWNQLTTLPAEVNMLQRLEQLRLTGNNLLNLPRLELPNLLILHLVNCHLSEPPRGMQRSPKLHTLCMGKNDQLRENLNRSVVSDKRKAGSFVREINSHLLQRTKMFLFVYIWQSNHEIVSKLPKDVVKIVCKEIIK